MKVDFHLFLTFETIRSILKIRITRFRKEKNKVLE